MAKYFIVFRPESSCEVNEPNSKEALACAIFSKVKSVEENNFFLAYESTSSMATFVALKKTAVASIEIDSNTEKLWKKHVLPIYEAEERFESFIRNSLDQIMISSIELDRVIYQSKYFELIQASDDMDFRYAHECLQNKVRPKISKVVSSIFKIRRL